jgi:hypothetical protein
MSRPAKAKLATLDQLDGRTIAAKRARDTISAIEADLGGAENLTTSMRQIIESAAVTSTMVADLGSRWLSGEQIDLALFCTLGNAQRRLFETIGLERAPRDVTSSIHEIAEEIEASKNEE